MPALDRIKGDVGGRVSGRRERKEEGYLACMLADGKWDLAWTAHESWNKQALGPLENVGLPIITYATGSASNLVAESIQRRKLPGGWTSCS